MADLDLRTDDEKRACRPDHTTRAPWKVWYDSLVGQQCYYCGGDIGEPTRATASFCLDRHPQCEFCNNAKYNNTPETFIALAHDIVRHLDDSAFVSSLTRAEEKDTPYDRWAARCGHKSQTVHITEDQRNDLLRQRCYYCGIAECGNISLTSGRDFAIGLVKPSCATCWRMRLVTTHDASVIKLRDIVTRHPQRPKNTQPTLSPPQKMKRRKIK